MEFGRHPVPRGGRAAAPLPRTVGVRRPGCRRSPAGLLSQPADSMRARTKAFEYCASGQVEGGIANFERTVDGFLAGLPYDSLLPAPG